MSKYIPNMSKTYQKHIQQISKNIKNISSKCPKHVQQISKQYKKQTDRSMPNKYPKHIKNTKTHTHINKTKYNIENKTKTQKHTNK